jgi:hypothetical protein
MRLALPIALAVSLTGCARAPKDPAADNTWDEHGTTHTGDGPVAAFAEGRTPHRLNVAQLDRSIERVFGKRWMFAGPPTLYIFDFLAAMLGQPDYISETLETRDPSPLFAKLMDHMASSVCYDAVNADGARPESDRVIARYPTDIDRNLRYLRLRLHGVYIPEDSSAGLDALRTLFETVRDNQPATVPPALHVPVAWMAVCVAMTTDPEFMIY